MGASARGIGPCTTVSGGHRIKALHLGRSRILFADVLPQGLVSGQVQDHQADQIGGQDAGDDAALPFGGLGGQGQGGDTDLGGQVVEGVEERLLRIVWILAMSVVISPF